VITAKYCCILDDIRNSALPVCSLPFLSSDIRLFNNSISSAYRFRSVSLVACLHICRVRRRDCSSCFRLLSCRERVWLSSPRRFFESFITVLYLDTSACSDLYLVEDVWFAFSSFFISASAAFSLDVLS